MFNGIVYKQGKIKKMKRNPKYVSGSLVMEISSNIKFKKKDVGESVCCDGVCLTLIGMRKRSFFFYLSKETLQRSNFKKAKIGNYINIEKSISHGKKISGHYIQGHVDTASIVKGIKIIERKIKPEEMSGFVGCFLTGTAAEVTPVSQIDKFNFKVCDLIKNLSDSYQNLVRKKVAA